MLLLRKARRVSSSSLALSSTRTITRSCMGGRQGEVEGGAAVGVGIGPDPAAVAMGEPRDGGQADAGAGELGLCVEALEDAEEFVAVGHVEAGAVVADEVGGLAVVVGDAELD